MGNVFDAMKKHQAEQASDAAAAPRPAPAEAVSAAPASAPVAVAARGRGPVAVNGYLPELVAHHDRGSTIAEQYRVLRTNLLAQYQDGRFCLLVTSGQPGEGKTITCLNLGVVLSERPEYRTLVVDFDLRVGDYERQRRFFSWRSRRSGMDRLLRIDRSPGMADVLRGRASVEEVTRPTAYPNLWVIPAGQAPAAEVGELLGKPEVDEIIGRLRRDYDYVLLDTPPLNLFSDAGILGRAAHEALLVVRMYKTAHEFVDRAIRNLHAANVKPVGVVLTHERPERSHKYYYKHYS